jgi:hypothetical protein
MRFMGYLFTSSSNLCTRSGECHLSAARSKGGMLGLLSQPRTQVPLY